MQPPIFQQAGTARHNIGEQKHHRPLINDINEKRPPIFFFFRWDFQAK